MPFTVALGREDRLAHRMGHRCGGADSGPVGEKSIQVTRHFVSVVVEAGLAVYQNELL